MNAAANAPLLVFHDLQGGLDYLSSLPLANPVLAEAQLTRFLDSLLRDPPDPGVLLTLLEQARVPMCFVEEEMARRYHNKALPLSEDEDAFFRQVVAAWRKMVRGYALCARLEEPEAGSAQYSSLMATILHRCLYYTGMVVVEHYRARRELPAGIWLELHGFYETAEEWGIAELPVEDVLENNLQATHCSAAYIALLLIDIASPYAHSVRNLNLIRRWAALWAPLVSIQHLDNDIEVPPYIVELMKDLPLHSTPALDPLEQDVRRLDTTRLGLQINHMLAQLRQRITPSQLGLGEETSGHVIRLLSHLIRPWTQSASPRKFRRFPSQGTARVAINFDAIHFFVSGREFVQLDAANTYSRTEFEELFTFRDQANPGQTLTIRPRISFPESEWSVINHSANGFRLARAKPEQKMLHGQLIGICPHDGDQFLLAQVIWLMQEESDGLVIGVATLPGMPTAIGARFAAVSGVTSEPFTRAFLLPALPAAKEEGSIVLPSGMYQASRVLDVFCGENMWQLRMSHIVERGTDFDRISYVPL